MWVLVCFASCGFDLGLGFSFWGFVFCVFGFSVLGSGSCLFAVCGFRGFVLLGFEFDVGLLKYGFSGLLGFGLVDKCGLV